MIEKCQNIPSRWTAQTFALHLQKQGTRPWLIGSEGEPILTFRQLIDISAFWAGWLGENVRRRQIAFVATEDPVALAIRLFVCWRRGLIPILVPRKTSHGWFEEVTQILQPSLYLGSEESPEGLPAGLMRYSISGDTSKGIVGSDLEFTLDAERDPWLLLRSSGTTGVPKCIPLSLAHMARNTITFHSKHEVGHDDIFLSTSELSYAHGIYNSLFTSLILGARWVWGGSLSVLTASKILDLAHRAKTTVYHLTPGMMRILNLMADRVERRPCWQKAISGTEPLPREVALQFTTNYATPVYQQYGMTEVLFISSEFEPHRGSGEDLSAGVPIGDAKVEIMRDNLTPLPRGEEGEICVASPDALGYYIGPGGLRIPMFEKGWFRTGDLGLIDSSGNLYITGRIKNIIKRAGVSINPEATEKILLQYPGVHAAAVVGIPDPLVGEEVYAAVVAEASITESELLTYLKQVEPSSVCPKKILFVEDLPVTESGKLRREEIRRRISEKTAPGAKFNNEKVCRCGCV